MTFRTSLYEFVFGPTWLDPVAGATVDSATGSSQVGSNTPILRASSEPAARSGQIHIFHLRKTGSKFMIAGDTTSFSFFVMIS
eukprot:COSAG02_NODE_2911_length_7765_cov_39.714975_4_plen_83_part_00